MRYSSNYKALQQELHAREPQYGTSGLKHAGHVQELAKRMNTRDVLDYGCGKQTLQKNIPFPITNYDPFIVGLDDEPDPHNLVVCSDVLEHIEPDCLGDVLAHLRAKTKQVLFVDVACRLAKKSLADGRNAHLIIQDTLWWLNQLGKLFDVQSVQSYEGGFVATFTPRENLK